MVISSYWPVKFHKMLGILLEQCFNSDVDQDFRNFQSEGQEGDDVQKILYLGQHYGDRPSLDHSATRD